MTPHSSTLAWKIPWTEEPGRLQSMGSQRVGHDWATELNWFSLTSFPSSSIGKVSACNAGEPGSIPGSGRSPREETGYPIQYSWALLVAQMVKNLPAIWETYCNTGDPGSIPGLGSFPETGHGLPLQCSCLENSHGQRSLAGYSPWGCKESDMTEQLSIHSVSLLFSLPWFSLALKIHLTQPRIFKEKHFYTLIANICTIIFISISYKTSI